MLSFETHDTGTFSPNGSHFRIQEEIKDGRLKFADKAKMKVDEDPLDVADTNYSEPTCIGEINMVEADQSDAQ